MVQEYYGEAGQLTFTTPELMADAGLYFTSLVGGSVAPVILSWTPTEGAGWVPRGGGPEGGRGGVRAV